ncbi:MAG: flagellar export chaperone FliS [Planctomycetes bacterium]|nr:flagellar export chaperone FliS [Planctomycetota bacterium]
MSYAQAAATYQRNAILTASPEKLVKLLYDGALKNLEKSKLGLTDTKTARSPEVGQSLSRAMGILGELRASLDHAAGGAIAKDLDRLYEYSLDQLSQANLTRTPSGVENTLKVVRTLKEGWDGIIAG